MADPITISVLTAAVTSLAGKAAEGAAGEAGKDLWTKVKGLFGWAFEPEPAALPAEIAKALTASPELQALVAALVGNAPDAGYAGEIVFHAKNVGIVKNEGQVVQHFN